MPVLGECQCGCGGSAPVATRDRPYMGHVKGQPVRFIRGHHARVAPVGKLEHDYEIRDGGFETPCWMWLYKANSSGYGRVSVDGRRDYAHRVFYERKNGSVPAGHELHHRCGNRLCVNPEHLQPVRRPDHAKLSPRVKLTAAKVAEIRNSLESVKALAERYGVARCTVSNIRARRIWRDV